MKKVLVPPLRCSGEDEDHTAIYFEFDPLGTRGASRDGLLVSPAQVLCLCEQTPQVILDSLKFDVEVCRNLFVAAALPA
jgi:hypothetical protein